MKKLNEVINLSEVSTYQKLNKYVDLVKKEKENRKARINKPHVMNYQHKETNDLIVPKGTVTLFYSNNTKFLDDVTDAFSKHDSNQINNLTQFIVDELSKREYKNLDYIFDIIDKNNIIDFEYNSKILLENIVVPSDLKFLILHFPYNGGKLNTEEFNLVEWYKDIDSGTEESKKNSVLIIRPPDLTESEIQALNKLPPEKFSANIASFDLPTASTPALAVVTAIAVINATPGAFGFSAQPAFLKKINRIQNAEDMIKELDPYTSAKHLTSMRKRMLESVL